jgi:hypothetical protein
MSFHSLQFGTFGEAAHVNWVHIEYQVCDVHVSMDVG